jgi:NitT/TauT family transport system substrate-binding protein
MDRLTVFSKLVGGLLIVGIIIGALYYLGKNPDVAEKIAPTGNPTATGGAGKESKAARGEKLIVGINTWGGFAGAVYYNGGFKASKSSKFYTEYGQLVEFKLIDDFNASREAWKSGDIDVLGFCTIDAFTTEINGLKQFDPQVIGQIDWSRGGDAIVVRRGINQVSDLKGKKIAVAPMTPSHTLLLWLMDAGEVGWGDVTIIPVSNGIDAADLFKKQQVDAAVVWSPDDQDCVAKIEGSKVLVSTKKASHIIADVWLVTKSTVENKNDALRAFVEGTMKGNGAINSDPGVKKEAATLLAEGFNQPLDFCMTAINNARLATLGDNQDFFDVNGNFGGVTGEKLYMKMAQSFARTKDNQGQYYITGGVPPWRTVAYPAFIRSSKIAGADQASEEGARFTAPTPELATVTPISTKKVTIEFASGSSALTDDARNKIDTDFLDLAKGFRDARIRIEGNTDNVGSYEMNKALSRKRAQAVADYLNKWFGRNRFVVLGNGPDKPVADNDTPEGRQRNRRTDFELLGQ